MKMLALLVSMPFESDIVRSRIKKTGKARMNLSGGMRILRGQLSGMDLVLCHTGIGKVNAAHAAARIIDSFPVNAIMNAGVGGAYPGAGLEIGDVAIASREIYGDEGVIDEDGWKGLVRIGIPLVRSGPKKYFNDFPLNTRILSDIRGVIRKKERDFRVVRGRFVTLSGASGTRQRAEKLESRFRAVCENMEGAAIAHICTMYGIPMIEIRGISNISGIRDRRAWDLECASAHCQEIVSEVIRLL